MDYGGTSRDYVTLSKECKETEYNLLNVFNFLFVESLQQQKMMVL